jgi:guanyl-specific ribonuclease Sa
MADWIDNLDKDQLENANLIAEEAKKAGIPPNLAVSMAFQESNLRHQSDNKITTSKKGALGIMQLMPITADELKVDPTDKEQNIRGGINYLKKMLNRFDNDPILAAAAYNHGAEGSFFKGGELPQETKNYLKKIKEYGGFEEPKAEEVVYPEEWQLLPATGYGDISKGIIEAGGAATGAALAGTGSAIKTAAKSAAKTAGEEIARQLIEAGKASSAGAVPEVSAATQGLIKGSGPIATTPAGGQGTQNWARAFGMSDPEALRARSMAEAHQMQKQAMAAEDKIKGMFGGAGAQYQMDPTRASLMIRSGEVAPKTPPFSLSQVVKNVASRYPELTSGISRVVSGGLGGFGGALGGMEAVERYKRGDVPAAALSGAGALASLGMIPAATAPIAAPIALGAGIGLGGYDLAKAVMENVRRGEKWAKEHPPTERELEEAKRAYFGSR